MKIWWQQDNDKWEWAEGFVQNVQILGYLVQEPSIRFSKNGLCSFPICYLINFCTSVQNSSLYNKNNDLACTDLVPSPLFFVQNVQKSALLPVDKSVDNSAAPHKSYPQISLCLWITFFQAILYWNFSTSDPLEIKHLALCKLTRKRVNFLFSCREVS